MTPINFNGLDTAVHGPIRLGILTALQLDGAQDFTTLKKRLETADGSLNLHLRNLEDCGYIKGKKTFVGFRPKTTYRLKTSGRKALVDYLSAMQQLIDAVENAEKQKTT